jgi:hypothetical protein
VLTLGLALTLDKAANSTSESRPGFRFDAVTVGTLLVRELLLDCPPAIIGIRELLAFGVDLDDDMISMELIVMKFEKF